MKNYNLEVLVSTMNQKDYSLIKKMNIQTDALFINQCDLNQYEELKKYEKNIRIISNTERGLSKSRNQALLNAKGDICLIADDDIKYVDGYEKK
ncbi:Glycosyl transferase family 2 [[Clostridium] sordellii]|uniref:glycosyltransferase n=1 Tax=Paraclostridium sordellii TaxID=1505 RepID=UPI0005DEC058|nr:glycosyltransferase [Paeniclostridium sordellii]CEP47881.1 Glycosyl transferase family 2 [[Clostridium] sordellii] [Paeniclostridium sordellii]